MNKKGLLMFLVIGVLFLSCPITLADEVYNYKEEAKIENLNDYEYHMLSDEVSGSNIETFYINRPDPEAIKKNMVKASEFGLDTKNDDNYKAFSAALAYCAENPNTYLWIDKGVYYFKTNKTLMLSGLKNVLIEGNGSEFIFETQKQFAIDECDGVELRDLVIDWNWEKDRIASLVKIQNKTDSSFEIKFLELDEVDENIPLLSFQQYDKNELIPGSYGEYKTFSPVEKPGSILSVEKLEPNVLKLEISEKFTTSFHNEEVYLLRHYTYGGAAFEVQGNSCNITFDNVSIYGSAGMGYVFGEKANHFQIINSYIGLRPGGEDKQRMSTTADGIHILNTGGYFRVDNCDFSYTGDDIFNIHDDMLKITKFDSKNQLQGIVTGGFVQKGDKIRIYNLDLEDIGFETEVLSNIRKGDGSTLLLKDEIPSDVEEGFFVYRSSTRTRNYVISNNYIHETKGRAALLNAPDGLFENNKLYRVNSECVQVRMDLGSRAETIWYEGSGAKNVVINGNVFEECAFGGKDSIITIDCNVGNKKDVLSDVHITNNKFLYCYGDLVSADNVTDLYIENNIIIDCGDIIISNYCGDVYQNDNIITYPSKSCEHTDTRKLRDRKPGCFEYGNTGITYCNQCHKIIDNSYRGIPPLKHKDLLEKRIDVEPTCVNDGSSSMVCSLCRTVVESGIVEPATGKHDYSKYVSLGGGRQKLVCRTCDSLIHFYDVDGTNDKTDIENYQYYYDPVYWAAENGITTGYPDGSFGPGLECDRRALATFIWRMNGSPEPKKNASAYFVDMGAYAANTAANKSVAWAYEKGIVKGYTENGKQYYKPLNTVTRRETMIMIYRVAGKPPVSGQLSFADTMSYKKGTDSYNAILWGSKNGITAGYKENGTTLFKPDIPCLREHIVTFLYRYAMKKG